MLTSALGRYSSGTAKWRLIHWYFWSTSEVLKHLLLSVSPFCSVFYETEVFRSTDPTWLTQRRHYQTTSKLNLLNWIKSLPFFVYWETFWCNSCWLTVTLCPYQMPSSFQREKKKKSTITRSLFCCSKQAGKERSLAMPNIRTLPPKISNPKAFSPGRASGQGCPWLRATADVQPHTDPQSHPKEHDGCSSEQPSTQKGFSASFWQLCYKRSLKWFGSVS